MTTIGSTHKATGRPWRPVQFLGSKLRSLDFIAQELSDLQVPSSRVWEPFTGSSVVSQRLAADGYNVWATDALESSAHFAASLLGVNRGPSNATNLLGAATEASNLGRFPTSWSTWLKREAKALAECDANALFAGGAEIPQRWRAGTSEPSLRLLFQEVEDAAFHAETFHDGLISATYAGSYFGIKQAIIIEQLRSRIDVVAPPGESTLAWVRSGLLTALCSAASTAVFSAGKHFAQPHKVSSDKNLSFHSKRIIRDRSVNIVDEFLIAAKEIDSHARRNQGQHGAGRLLVENVNSSHLVDHGISVVYADPPYTAQQYSRFYHVLEVLVSGVPARLQRVNGKVTSGLYPDKKYHSPFSSRRNASNAFRHLISTTRAACADLILSYSDTRGESTGNARVISLASLVQCVEDIYGTKAVNVRELDFRYRQFNNGAHSITNRSDPEYIVTGRVNVA